MNETEAREGTNPSRAQAPPTDPNETAALERAAAEVKRKNEEPWHFPRCLDYVIACKTSGDYAKGRRM